MAAGRERRASSGSTPPVALEKKKILGSAGRSRRAKLNGHKAPAQAPLKARISEAVKFLQQLRPGGPWLLTAIVPDGPTETITARAVNEVAAFIEKYSGARNIYYSVNPTRTALDKKAKKTDIAAIEFALADLDPAASESLTAAKARYLKTLNGGAFQPSPTAGLDSGNGIQCLWRLQEPVALGTPVMVEKTKTMKDGKTKTTRELEFSPEDQAKINDVESRVKAIMLRLGAKPGTQNIDRILRLPGTVNLPNLAKREVGRVPCMTKTLWFKNTRHPLSAFPAETDDGKKPKQKRPDPQAGLEEDELERTIHDRRVPKGERSERVWWVCCEMLRRGYLADGIVAVLLDRTNGISEHVYDQSKPQEYAERQVVKATADAKFVTSQDGKIIPSDPRNIRIGLLKLGVALRHDRFADRILISGLPGFGPALEDAAVNRLWLTFGQRFRFRPDLEAMRIVFNDTARLNGFHPVRDYLNGLVWDGKPRLDRWLVNYAGAVDSAYVRAVSALTLVAAVRRVRTPGCKFDEMLVLEQPLQGTDKSSALAILAVWEDWFSDDLPLNMDSKRVIESLRGRWIVEAAELSGMKKADVEHLKAALSRRIDRARMAYGRLPLEAPRQCIFIGTTNKSEYLRDTTGNRRFWPVLVERFDLDALRRDRDQLWAEAAAREAKGESIRLARELWPAAARAQEQRLADDPFVAVLAEHLGHYDDAKIKSTAVWEILNLRGAQLTQEAYVRVAEAMKRIGWKRPNSAGTARFDGKLLVGHVRGNARWEIKVERDQHGLYVISEEEEEKAKAKNRQSERPAPRSKAS
jgi:hypothetical protein